MSDIKNPVQVKTRSYAWDLPFVELSDLFSHAARCDHSGRNDATPSGFERDLIKQGFILSTSVNGYKGGLTPHIFLKPTKALQDAIDSSPYSGLPCEWVGLEKVGQENDQRIMLRLSMVSRDGIYFTYDLMAGFITLEQFQELKVILNTKTEDHIIEL